MNNRYRIISSFETRVYGNTRGWTFIRAARILPFTILALISFISCGPSSVENCPPGVVCGKITMYNQADPGNEGMWFDFSEGRIIVEQGPHKEGDFCLFRTFLRASWPVKCGIQDSQADSLHRRDVNPTYDYDIPDEFRKNADMPIYSGHVYYMVTGEGHYAKIKIIGSEMNANATAFNYIIFEWAYQPNGTEFFGVNADGTPVKREGEVTPEG